MPWIAHWSAVIAAGGVSTPNGLTMHWIAAMLAAAGVATDLAYPLDGANLLPLLHDPQTTFERLLAWRMKHRGQRAYRPRHRKYLMVDGHKYLANLPTNASAPTTPPASRREPARLAALRQAWANWKATMPLSAWARSLSGRGRFAADDPQVRQASRAWPTCRSVSRCQPDVAARRGADSPPPSPSR